MNTTASKTYNGKKTITVNSDGNNGIHGYVKDKAGNEGKCDKSATTTKQYTITFNGNGGTPNPKTKTVYWGDKIGSLASISRYGYNLSGWFNANTGGSVVNASTIMPRRNVTYYARWTPKKVTVTFNCNGGSGGGSQTFTYGASNSATGSTSVAIGNRLNATNDREAAFGSYNVSNKANTTFGDSGNTLFSVGNGTSSARHNAFEIRQNGDIYVNDGTNDVRLQDTILALGGLKLVKLTQNEYDQLATKDPDTLYIISNVVS